MIDLTTAFAKDVRKGLEKRPRSLPSKYFYDEAGDALFQQIMSLPEYYLTRSELEIFETQWQTILRSLGPIAQQGMHLVDLGAGDGAKTKLLLRHWLRAKAKVDYVPIDISENALQQLQASLGEELPDLSVQPLQREYFAALRELSERDHVPKVVLFLGSNIGNFSLAGAQEFLSQLRASLEPGDFLLMGADLKKDPKVVVPAYADSQGVTAAFNLNLLKRINQELQGNFDLAQWQHFAEYNPHSGEMRSYLLSKKYQRVHIGAVEQSFQFEAWEGIHTEVSRKFSRDELHELCSQVGFAEVERFEDSQGYFASCLWQK